MKKLFPIILILLSVGVFFFFIDGEYKKLKELQIEQKENEKTLADAKKLESELQNLQNKYNSFSPQELDKLNKLLPEAVDNVRLILDINNIADLYNIDIKNISVSGGPTAEVSTTQNSNTNNQTQNTGAKYGTITLSFSVTTDYENFKAFMRELEKSLRLVDVVDFSVSNAQGGLYNYSVVLNTYWLR